MKKLFIGIDFAKEKFDAAIIEACGLKAFGNREYGTFTNDKKGYRQFFKWVKTNADKSVENEWLFCGEDTGSCSLGLSKWLYGKGLDIWIENAYSIKHSSGIQRVKSDKTDSSMIAEYAWRHQDKAVLFEPLSESLVDNSTLASDWEPLFINMNDGTNEGIRHKSKPYFSAQFHPEAASGPTDTEFLFDEFVNML